MKATEARIKARHQWSPDGISAYLLEERGDGGFNLYYTHTADYGGGWRLAEFLAPYAVSLSRELLRLSAGQSAEPES